MRYKLGWFEHSTTSRSNGADKWLEGKNHRIIPGPAMVCNDIFNKELEYLRDNQDCAFWPLVDSKGGDVDVNSESMRTTPTLGSSSSVIWER